jgi:hypothetical protein
MAILENRQLLLAVEPAEAMRSLDGRVWRRTVANADVEDFKQRVTPDLLDLYRSRGLRN